MLCQAHPVTENISFKVTITLTKRNRPLGEINIFFLQFAKEIKHFTLQTLPHYEVLKNIQESEPPVLCGGRGAGFLQTGRLFTRFLHYFFV